LYAENETGSPTAWAGVHEWVAKNTEIVDTIHVTETMGGGEVVVVRLVGTGRNGECIEVRQIQQTVFNELKVTAVRNNDALGGKRWSFGSTCRPRQTGTPVW